MSRTKQLVTILESLEKKEFDKIVKIYLQKEYSYEHIVFTDGTGDAGLDIKIFDFDSHKIQYQLTTQKNNTKAEQIAFYKKITQDLQKAKSNHVEFGYRDKLIFFYSNKLTNSKIKEYEKLAFKEYSINLELIEANRLAEEAENIIEIQAELYKINELDKFHIQNNQFENNLFYDLLSFGKPNEFKINIIDSFVLQLFYLNQTLTQEEITNACKSQFSVNENSAFYDRLLSRFQTDKKIIKNKLNNTYSLTLTERDFLKNKNNQFELDKNIFIKGVSDILKCYHQENDSSEYIKELKQLYVDNFNTDLSNIISDEIEFSNSNKFKPFIRLIEKKIKNKQNANKIAIELLEYCLDNKFIQKIAATKVYSNKINNRRLENYINKRKKIFIDTAVGLYSMCYYYNPKSNYSNYFFRSIKTLIEYSRKEKNQLFISERYIWEIQNHIKDALRLIPFTNIPNFSTLGSSRNVFYNFYNYLISCNEVDSEKSFSDFLKDFNFSENQSQNSINSIIEFILSNINITKQILPKDYEIQEVNELFDDAMKKFYKNKTNFARNCDSIMLKFLADNDVSIHAVDPVFITWDKTFFEVHRNYNRNFPNSQNWLMLTPNKIIDIYALLKFSINSETVTEDLLALISDDIITNTHSLLDTLTLILNPLDEVGREYTTMLAEIREREINQINNHEFIPPENYEGEAVIDDIFFNLTNYYKEKINRLKDFQNLFTKKEYINDIKYIINNAISEFYEKKEIKGISESLYHNFDKLLLSTEDKV